MTKGIEITILLLMIGILILIIIVQLEEPNKCPGCPDVDTTDITYFLNERMEQADEHYKNVVNQIKLKDTSCNPTYYVEGCDGTFENIAKTLNDAREYVIHEFDCTEKSKLLASTYSDLGWDARTKLVNMDCEKLTYNDKYTYKDCQDNNGLHEIVEIKKVYVESTTGKVIEPNDERYKGLWR